MALSKCNTFHGQCLRISALSTSLGFDTCDKSRPVVGVFADCDWTLVVRLSGE